MPTELVAHVVAAVGDSGDPCGGVDEIALCTREIGAGESSTGRHVELDQEQLTTKYTEYTKGRDGRRLGGDPSLRSG